jgi:hypothetical protein
MMCSDHSVVQITPETKIDGILASRPHLESILLSRSPSYARIQQPALRASVLRNTTLAQLAQADGLAIGSLVAELRHAAGLEVDPASATTGDRPEWADTDHAARSFDARAIIENGGHPLDRVLEGVGCLAPGEVYELITPFVPGPLIQLVRQRGFDAHTSTEHPGECYTYFRAR